MKTLLIGCCAFLLIAAGAAPGAFGADKQPAAAPAVQTKSAAPPLAKNPEVHAVKPRKPVKIKIHRTAKGEYAWDITGDSPDDIVRADARLKKLLHIEP
jgi:Tfp pilus assembly protein FimV